MSYKNFTTAGIKLEIDVKDAFKGVEDTSSFLNKQLKSMELHADSFTSKWGDMTRGIKDTKRIVSGILISQAFYTLSSAVVQTTTDIVNFSANMEQAAISMEYFIKNAEGGANALAKSQAYLREINRFAARTPFSTEQTLQLSRYMQAMGMGIETTKSFFTVMTDAASATGGTSDQLDRAVIAMGRMKAQGRITSREIRQLAAANIPIYEILREELHLTGAQVAKLGDQWVSADVAMTGILHGLEKRYEGAADRMADTFTGMTNIIKDNIKIIGQVGGASLFEGLTGGMMTFRNALQEYREIAIEQGAGGLLNELLHNIDTTGALGTKILTLVGTYYQLKDALKATYIAAKPVRELLGNTLYASVITVTNGIIGLSKVVNTTIKGLERFGISGFNAANMLASLFITYKVGSWLGFMGQAAVKGAWALIETAKAASMILPAALQARAGIAALTMGIGGLIVYGLAAVGVFKSISSTLAGLDTAATGGNILPDSYMKEFEDYQKQFEEYNKAIDEYGKSFDAPFEEMADGADEAVDGFDKVKDASKKAANAVKNDWLASFDEVYTIPKEVANAGDKLGDLLENPDFGLGLQPPVFKFPKIESIEITSPKLNIKDVFGDSPWADMDIDGLDKSWWKKMLPGLISLGLMRTLAPFAKQLQEHKNGPKTGAKAPVSSGPNMLNMTPAELKDAIAKLGNKLNERLVQIEALMERIRSGQLTGADLDRVLKILADANTKALAELERLNDLNVLAGKETTHISSTLKDLAKVLKENNLAQLLKEKKEIEALLRDGGGTESIDSLLARLKKVDKAYNELMGTAAKSVTDYLNSLGDAYSDMAHKILERRDVATQLKLIKTFNQELKDVNKILSEIGEIKLDPKYEKMLEATNNMAIVVEEYGRDLKKYAESMQKLEIYTDERKLATDGGRVVNAAVIDRLNKKIDTLRRTIRTLEDNLKTLRIPIENAVEEIYNAKIAAIREREERAKELAAERKARVSAENEEIRRNKAEIAAREKASRTTDALNETIKRTNELINERKAQIELDRLYEMDADVELQENKKELQEISRILTEMKEVFYDTSKTAATDKQLVGMAKDFGIEQKLNTSTMVDAYTARMEELGRQVEDLTHAIEMVTYEPAQLTAKDIVDAYMQASREVTPVMPGSKLPAPEYVDNLPASLARLYESAETLTHAFTATGTKMLTLSRGIGEYGNSLPEIFANILKDNYENLIPNLTSREFTPFLELVSNLGIELEEHVIHAAKSKVSMLGELFRSESSIGTADKSLITQIDAFIQTIAGKIIPTDIKTISGDMRDTLWESGNKAIEQIEKYKAEWFNQFAAQVYTMTQGRGGDFGLITFNRDYDFGEVIAKRFHEAFKIGKLGNVFDPEVIKKATQGKTDKKAIEKYIRTLQEEVFFDTFTQTIDMSPLKEAIDAGVIHYSREMLEQMRIPQITAAWRQYTDMLTTVMKGDGIEKFLNTYVRFETDLGDMTFPVNVASIPRVYTKAGNSLNKWLQTVLDQPEIKLSGTFKSDGKAFQKLIDKVINDFNKTLDTEELIRKLTIIRQDIVKVLEATEDAFKPLEMADLSKEFNHITGLLEGTTVDFRNLIEGLDAVIGKPGTIEHTGRILRSTIERTNTINRNISDGLEITASELYAVKRNLQALATRFGADTDLVFRQSIRYLNDLMAEIKTTGDAAILDLATNIKLPFKTLGIEDALAYAAGEIRSGITAGLIKFADIVDTDEAVKAFNESIKGLIPQKADGLYPSMERLAGAFKGLVVDIEATGIDLRNALVSQIAVMDTDTGSITTMFINRGHEQNKKVLAEMQDLRDANSKFYEFVEKQMNNIETRTRARELSVEGIARQLENAPDPHKYLPEFLEKLKEVIVDVNKSVPEIVEEMLDWAELTDVAKVWRNVSIEMMDSGKTVKEAGEALKAMIENMPVEWYGHNLGEYDLLALTDLFPDIDFSKYADTLSLAKKSFEDISFAAGDMNLKLTTLYETLTGKSSEMAHMADKDIEMTYELLKLFDSGFVDKVADAVRNSQEAGTKITIDVVKQIAKGITDGLSAAAPDIGTAPVDEIIKGVKTTINNTMDAAASSIDTSPVKGIVDAVKDTIGNTMEEAVSEILKNVDKATIPLNVVDKGGEAAQVIQDLGTAGRVPQDLIDAVVTNLTGGYTRRDLLTDIGYTFRPGIGSGDAPVDANEILKNLFGTYTKASYTPPPIYPELPPYVPPVSGVPAIYQPQYAPDPFGSFRIDPSLMLDPKLPNMDSSWYQNIFNKSNWGTQYTQDYSDFTQILGKSGEYLHATSSPEASVRFILEGLPKDMKLNVWDLIGASKQHDGVKTVEQLLKEINTDGAQAFRYSELTDAAGRVHFDPSKTYGYKNFSPLTSDILGDFSGRVGTSFSPGYNFRLPETIGKFDVPFGGQDIRIGRFAHETMGEQPHFWGKGDGGSGFYKYTQDGMKLVDTTIAGKVLSVAGDTLKLINAGTQAYDMGKTQIGYEAYAKGLTKQDTTIEWGGLLGMLGITGRGSEYVKTGPGISSSIIYDNLTPKQIKEIEAFNAMHGGSGAWDSTLMGGKWADMASPFDRTMKGLIPGFGGTRSGTENTLNKYFDMGPEDQAFWGAKYISGGETGLSGLLGSILGRGTAGVIKNRKVEGDAIYSHSQGMDIPTYKKLSKEDYIWDQMGSGSQFDALATHILTSGDMDSKTSKKFFKEYGDYMDTFKEASGMDDSWNEAAKAIFDNMGTEINKALEQAGLAPIDGIADIDLTLKPFFDSIMKSLHSSLIDDIAGKLAIDREHTYGHSLSDSRVDRVFESDRMDNLPVGALNMLQNELGITISKINDEFGKISFDTSILTEELSGWTKRLPEGLDLSAANLTPKEVSILAQAGIQVNGDGSVTFMKAPVEAMSGTSRSLDITLDAMSKAVLDKLSAQGISVGIDGSLDLSAEELSSKMTSALFKTNTSLQGRVSDDMKQALSGLGNVLDSGYIEITNTAVLNGSMTIAEYIGSMGEKANELSPKVLETLLALDEVIAQGGEATALSVAQWADGIVMPSPINEEALTEEMRTAFAAVGITFEQGAEGFMMVVNKLGDDLSDGVTLMPKELWDQLDSDIVEGLKAMGVTITEQGGYVRVDLTTTLKELVDVEEITPSIEAAMDQLGATFIVEGGKIVGVADESGKELTDGMLQISERILSDIDPATLKALEALGVTIEEENEKMFVNFTGMTETGIEDVIELYVNRPDLWDQIPDSIKTVLEEANIMNNEGMLTIKTDMLGMLVEVGEDWVGNWNKLPPETQKALGLTDAEVKDGLFKITRTTEDAGIDGLLEGQILVPFSELPPEIKKKMVGPGGVDAELANSYFIIEGTTESGMASMFDAVHIGFGNAAKEAGDGAAAIAKAVQGAMKEVANLNAVKVKKSHNPFANKDKPKWNKNKTGTGYTVRYGGNVYTAPVAKSISQAQAYINQKYGVSVPALKEGGLITGDGLYRAGEFGRTEAVLPLEDPAAMARVGAAVAAFMPFSNVFDIGTATQGALVDRINTVLTARAAIDMDFQRELHETKLEIFGEASERSLEAAVDLHTLTEELINEVISTNEILQNTIAANRTAVNDMLSGLRENGNLFTSSLRDATHSINDAIRNTTSMAQSSARDIISAIQSSSGSISSAIGGITLGDGSRTSSSDSHSYDYYDYDDDYNSRYDDYSYNDYKNDYVDKSPQNKLGMSDTDFHNYVMFKKDAHEEYDRMGKWNKGLNRQAQTIRDKYGIGSDDYNYNDLKNYIGSARGSLVTKDALYRAGEGGLNEAIIPLERPQIMERVGRSIASFMPDASRLQPAMGMQDAGVRRISQAPAYAPQQHMSEDMIAQRVLEVVLPAMAGRSEGESNLRPMYVGTLVADERGLKELNKKMKVIEASEKKRGVR